MPVFKILLQPEWAVKTHEFYQSQFVLHVVREPVGFIGSWMSRYVQQIAKGDLQAVHAQNLSTLDPILDYLGGSLLHGRGFSVEALIETELWRWHFMNTRLHDALAASHRYRVVRYEDLISARLDQGCELLRWLGLEVDQTTRSRLEGMENTLFKKTKPHPVDAAMVEDIAAHVLGTQTGMACSLRSGPKSTLSRSTSLEPGPLSDFATSSQSA